MKKKFVAGLATGLMLAGLSGEAGAMLTTIGTASYNSGTYKLIWDDNNNGNSVVWLDYSNASETWANQNTWAAGLNNSGVLTYNLSAGYSVDWGSNDWRLPATVDGIYQWGNTGTTTAGYNITNSEMGHLFYTELGNHGYKNSDETTNSYAAPEYFLTNVGDFVNLTPSWYWSGTGYSANPRLAWGYSMRYGGQDSNLNGNNWFGLAVRTGQVTYSDPGPGGAAPVPEPATMLLMGTGLAGLVGGRWKKARQGRIA